MDSTLFHRFLVTPLIAVNLVYPAIAEEKQDDLRGQWKQVESVYGGKRLPAKNDLVWICDGSHLYTRLETKLLKRPAEDIFEIEVNSKANPKELDLYIRTNHFPKPATPERACYRFVGDQLEVVQTSSPDVRPKSFEMTDRPGEITIKVFKRISHEAKIPDNMLEQLDFTPLHSTHTEADAALLTFWSSVLRGDSLEALQPLIADGKAKHLTDLIPNREKNVNAENALKSYGTRDLLVGERIYLADGTVKVITDKDVTPSRVPLMLVEVRRDQAVFWLSKEGKQWKVDVSNMLDLLRTPGPPLFGGIRQGMDAARIPRLLEDYQKAGAFTDLKIIKSSDSSLTVDLVEGETASRLMFYYSKGKVTNVARSYSAIAK